MISPQEDLCNYLHENDSVSCEAGLLEATE